MSMILVLVFAATFAAILSGVYLVFDAKGRKRLRTRLAAIQEASKGGLGDSEVQLFRREVLSEASFLTRWLVSFPIATQLKLWIEQSGLAFTPWVLASAATLMAVLSFLAGLVAGLSVGSAALAACLAASFPFLYVAYRRRQRLKKFEQDFPEAMDMLARAVTAGFAFTGGLELIAQEMADPLAREFKITYEQQNLGLPLREALGNLAIRVPLPDVKIFVALLQIQQESGGNLAEMLNNLSQVTRERFKLLRQVRVYTAEGRLSMVVLTALPPVAALLFMLTSPGYLEPLYTDPLGQRLLVLAVIMQVVGFLTIKKIVHLKV